MGESAQIYLLIGFLQGLKGEESFVMAGSRCLAIEGLVRQAGAESEGWRSGLDR
jgi:hypothetical protein